MTTDNNDEMRLITLAIHTYEKAQLLQILLRNVGIESYLHNIHQIQPIISSSVRVRINECDLPAALKVIEDNHWYKDEISDRQKHTQRESNPFEHNVLIPIDFNECTDLLVRVGFDWAYRNQARVTLMHVRNSVGVSTSIPINLGATGGVTIDQNHHEYQALLDRMCELSDQIKQRISRGELPSVEFVTRVDEGYAPDRIVSHARHNECPLILMGARNVDSGNNDLIGSVAAEVTDSCTTPVLIIPNTFAHRSLLEVQNIAVAENFDTRDMVLFDRVVEMFASFDARYTVFNARHITENNSQDKLRKIVDFYKSSHPTLPIAMQQLGDGEFASVLNDLIVQNAIDLIVVNKRRRKLLARIFNPTMARKMLFHTQLPLLVLNNINA